MLPTVTAGNQITSQYSEQLKFLAWQVPFKYLATLFNCLASAETNIQWGRGNFNEWISGRQGCANQRLKSHLKIHRFS